MGSSAEPELLRKDRQAVNPGETKIHLRLCCGCYQGLYEAEDGLSTTFGFQSG